jgi:hypothetical protein
MIPSANFLSTPTLLTWYHVRCVDRLSHVAIMLLGSVLIIGSYDEVTGSLRMAWNVELAGFPSCFKKCIF